jgi:signal transduction histidine kinase
MLNVPSLVQEWVQAAIKKQNKDKSLGLNITIEGGVPPIYADRDLMQRLLQQLLDQITAATKPEPGRAVRISVRHQEGQVWIDVTLEGFPIRQTDPLRRLTRLAPGANVPAGSTALDLSLAITIAHGMGGQVWVRDQKLAGSAIVICFPSMKR